MATSALPVERLRQYLRELPPKSRALLITELERAAQHGDEIPGGGLLLQEVRALVRESGRGEPRIGNEARLFFRPLEPFLIDRHPGRKIPARVARTALEPIWEWMTCHLLPAESKHYCDELNRADNLDVRSALAHPLQELAARRMRLALEATKSDEKARRRLAMQIETPHALEEARDIAAILAGRAALEGLASRLPNHIPNFGEASLENVRSLLDSSACPQELLAFALVLVMKRLAAPWQLIRLAIRAADSDDATRIAACPCAVGVSVTLGEIERMVGDLRADLKRGATTATMPLLKCIHDSVRGVRTELDLSADSAWARQLAAIRSEISDALTAEIEAVPGRVRRLLRPRPSTEIAPGSTLDQREVADTEALIAFVAACRTYASELAVNEVTLRSFQGIQQHLDTSIGPLLDALRLAGEPDYAFRRSQVDAAIRFCAKIFGKEYASLLTRAAGMAVSAERRAGTRS